MTMRVRQTRQLKAIHDVLKGTNRAMLVDEIHEAAQKREKGLGIATVYRSIKALVDAGTVAAINLPGEGARFERTGKGHHHHFQCHACGRVFDTRACLGNLRRLVPRQFQLTGHEIVLYGRCAECRG